MIQLGPKPDEATMMHPAKARNIAKAGHSWLLRLTP
jgi:hypothetical protein